MIPMCIATPSAAEKPQGAAPQIALAALRGVVPAAPSYPGDVRVSGRTRRMKDFEDLGERGAGDTVVSQRYYGDCESEGQTQRWKIQHLLGRSTKEH